MIKFSPGNRLLPRASLADGLMLRKTSSHQPPLRKEQDAIMKFEIKIRTSCNRLPEAVIRYWCHHVVVVVIVLMVASRYLPVLSSYIPQ